MMTYTARDRLKLLGGGAASVFFAGCGGGSSTTPPAATPPAVIDPPPAPVVTPRTLTDGLFKDSFSGDFQIGCALSSFQVQAGDLDATLGQSQFNSVTPSFQLKANEVSPTEGVFNFDEADRIVDWAIANDMAVRGHALVWHESTPTYFYEGTPAQVRTRLETYVSTVVEHFRGRIPIWDVANEVVSVDIFRGDGNGAGPDRQGRWYEASGNTADYIDWAFHAARDADPDALLFLNEYSTENAIKQPWMIEILQRLVDRGVPIDGVGHQFHLFLDSDPAELMQAIDAVDNQFMGLINHVTELDVDFYSDPGSCWSSQTNCDPDLGPVPPPAMLATQAEILRAVYAGLRERSSVTSVTTWGVTDNESWLNRSPAERFNYPLLFDRAGDPKPAFWAIVDPDYVIPTE